MTEVNVPAISPEELAERTDVVIVDIRPLDEREAVGLGFVPGSLSAPDDPTLLDLSLAQDGSEYAVVCMSGRRAGELVEALRELGREDVMVLKGGILGWHDAELPVSRPGITIEEYSQVSSPDEIPRIMLSCFVGQMVTSAMDQDVDLDFSPDEMLRECFELAGVDWDAPDIPGLRKIIECAGLKSRAIGTDLQRLADNQSHFLALLHELEAAA